MKKLVLLMPFMAFFTVSVFAEAPAKAEKPVAIIDTVSEAEATGDVAAVYKEMKGAFGRVINPIKLYSTNPAMLRQRWDGFKQLGEHKTVGPKMQTMIRMLVSAQHECEYCIGFNEAILINQFKLDGEKVLAMKEDPTKAPLPEKEKALLLFSLKATNHPKSTTAEDIVALRKLGWSDAEIFFATSYAAEMVATDILINAFHVAKDY